MVHRTPLESGRGRTLLPSVAGAPGAVGCAAGAVAVRRARWGCAALSLLLAAWRVAEFRLQIGETLIPGLGFYTRTDIRLDALLWGC